MDRQRKNLKQPSGSIKVERKIIEKNRRNHMKILCNNLFSLLPHHSTNPKEGLSVPDQIDEAVKYIKSLDSKLKKSKEEKDRLMLMARKRSPSPSPTTYTATTGSSSSSKSRSTTSFCKSSTPPNMEISQVGSSLKIALTSGSDYQFLFHEIICLIHQQGAEVLHANYSVVGNMIFHIVHAEISESMLGVGAARIITEKLNELVHGCMNEEDQLIIHPELLWNIEMHNEMWTF